MAAPTSAATPASTPVLADVLVDACRRTFAWAGRASARATDVSLIIAGALLVAVLAQVEIPLPLVPITGQTLGVLVVGSALGARRGAAALLTYMGAGLAGLPVFAGFAGGAATVLSPSFGFILGFVPAAALAGYFAERAWDRRSPRAVLGFLLASAVPFLVGVPYLALILNALQGAGMGLGAILAAGLWPFIPTGILKAVIAAVAMPLAWKGVRRIDARR